MLKFLLIGAQNFLSFGTYQELPIGKPGFHLIKGLNLCLDDDENSELDDHSGAGKSNIPFIIEFTLYGTVSREKKITKNRIIHKKFKKDCFTRVILKVDNTKYKIERYREHSEYKNELLLFEEKNDKWEDISAAGINDTQRLINNIIIINDATFLKSHLLSRDDISRNNFFSLNEADKAKIIENISQVSKFKTYYNRVIEKRKNLRKQHTQKETEVVEKLKQVNEFKKLLKSEIRQIRKSRNNILNDIEDYEQELNEILDLPKEVKLENILPRIESAFELKDEIDNLCNQIESKNNEMNTQEKHVKKLKKDFGVLKRRIEDDEDDLKNLKPVKCQKCGAIQDEEEFNKEVTKVEQRIENNRKEISNTKKEYQKEKKIFNKLELEHDDLNTKTLDLSDEFRTCGLPKNILEFVENSDSDEKIDEKIKSIQDEIKALKRDLGNVSTANITKYVNKVRTHRRALVTSRNERDMLSEELEIAEFSLNLLNIKKDNSIKQYIVGRIVPVLNHLFQLILDRIFNNKIQCSFDSLLHETIIYDDEDYDYVELCTGERNKLCLSNVFALFDITRINLIQSNILFLDEIFTNLDIKSILKFLDIIKEKYARNCAIYIITHQREIEESLEYETETLVKKENWESELITSEVA